VAGLAASFGSGAMTNSIAEIEQCPVMLVIGSNTTENHPVLSTMMKRAVLKHGAKIIVADPRRIPLVKDAALWLRQRPGTDLALINGLLHVILAEGLQDQEFIDQRTEGFEALKASVEKYDPAAVEEITGIPAADIEAAARLIGTAERAGIFYAMGITQHTVGTDNVKALANLAMATGNVGKESAGVNPLRGQNNVQGACDMGALPGDFPAYQKVANPEARAKFAQAWGLESITDTPGLTVTEMVDAAAEGKLKALYIMGENSMVSDPDLNHLRHALDKLDFLVVQDIFLTETAQKADVVLPSACWAEKDGTFTNTERRVQLIRKAVTAPGQAWPDWKILSELAGRLGQEWDYSGPEEIMAEIAAVTPSYAGITYPRLESLGGLHWPCPSTDHGGTCVLHVDGFARGKGMFHVVEHQEPAELPDDTYPYILTTGRNLYQYHTGSMTRRSVGLADIAPECLVEINPLDAENLGLATGDAVKVSSRRGSLEAKVWVTDKVAPQVVFIPFHYAEAAANELTNPALDPISKIPEFKVCAVSLEKAA
jgi:formate dehydrogenase alpha subunit